MKILAKLVLLGLVAVETMLLPGNLAQAESLTWTFQNDHTYSIQLEFYSQDRKHVWPGGNKAYVLDDSSSKDIVLSCNAGENICYGAWVENDSSTYWGVGLNDKEACDDCCYICDGGVAEAVSLTD